MSLILTSAEVSPATEVSLDLTGPWWAGGWLLTMMSSNCSTLDSRPSVLTVNWKIWLRGVGGPPICPEATWMFCALHRALDVEHSQAVSLELVGIQPHPHAVGPGATEH